MNDFDTWISAQHSDFISVTFLTLKVRNRKKIYIFLDINIKKKLLHLKIPTTSGSINTINDRTARTITLFEATRASNGN